MGIRCENVIMFKDYRQQAIPGPFMVCWREHGHGEISQREQGFGTYAEAFTFARSKAPTFRNDISPTDKAEGDDAKEDCMTHPILYRGISEVLCWIRLATEDESPAFKIAGISVSKNRPVENLSTDRLPSNIPQPQILAHLLADLAHNWPDMAAGTNTFHTLTGAAMACRKLAEHSFNGEAWRTMIRPGLIELAAAFDQAGN